MPLKFNRLTLLANIFSLQFTEISEYKPSSSYRASKSRLFPYIHCKSCRVCPTTKMASATVKPSVGTKFIEKMSTDSSLRKQPSFFAPGPSGASREFIQNYKVHTYVIVWKSQRSFSQNATQAGSEEGWLLLQATLILDRCVY